MDHRRVPHTLCGSILLMMLGIAGCGLLDIEEESVDPTEEPQGGGGATELSGTASCNDTHDDMDALYRVTKTYTIPSGCSVTFGAHTTTEVLDDIVVNGELHIEEGAHFLVDKDVTVRVNKGTLTIAGTDTAKVRFDNYTPGTYWGRGEDDSYWYDRYAISLSSNANATSSITHCVIDSATVGIAVEKDGIAITRSTFSNCAYAGVYFDDAGPRDSSAFQNNSFVRNGKTGTYFPLYIDATYLSRLSGTSVFTDNTTNAVAVERGKISESGSWKMLDVPYVFRDYATIDNTNGVDITIRPGARFSFFADAYLSIDNGTLIAEGTSADSISFGSFESGKYWGHGDDDSYWYDRYAISFGSDANANSSLKYCTFDSATVAVRSEKDGITISHSAFRNCAYAGIYFDACGPKDSASFIGNAFTANGKSASYFPLYLEAPYLSRLSGTSVFSDNAVDAIAVEGENVSESGTWKALDVPYVFRDHAKIDNANGVVVTIEPGAEFLFLDDMYLTVDRGTLIAEGTESDSIRFANYLDGTYWGHGDLSSGMYDRYGIAFTNRANATSSLSYCVIERAVVGINIDETAVHVSHCTIRDCESHGIYSTGAGGTDVDAATITFANNGESPPHLHKD